MRVGQKFGFGRLQPGERRALGLGLAATGLTYALGVLLYAWTQDRCPGSLTEWLSVFNRWDAPHYLSIATNGYRDAPGEAQWIVFFPFYPFVVRAVSWLLNMALLPAALLVSNGAFLGGILAFYRLARLDLDERAALIAVAVLCLFPTSYFFHMPYTESMFFALTVSSFYCARTNRWQEAGILGALATATRVTGLALIPALVLVRWAQNDGERSNDARDTGWIVFASSGFLLYMGINYWIFGDPFHFVQVQRAEWHKTAAFPWEGIWASLATFPRRPLIDAFMVSLAEPAFALAILAVGVALVREKQWPSATLVLVTWLFVTSIGFLLSIPRFTLVLFPIPLWIASVLQRRGPTALILWFVGSIFLLAVFLSRYVQGDWAF